MDTAKTVANLKIGQQGIIEGFKDAKLSLKLLDMGCLPGTKVKMKFFAPLGDPICIQVDGYNLSLRVAEANTISLAS